MSEPAPMAHRIALLRTSTDDELRRLLESIDKIRADASTERTQKERLALELARADEERERLTKEMEEARRPRKFPRAATNPEFIDGNYMLRLRAAMPEDASEWALNALVIRTVLLALEQLSNEGEAG